MRVVVCGGRTYADHRRVSAVLDLIHRDEGPITVIIHGDQKGAETYAKHWAIEAGVPHAPFPVDWQRYKHAHHRKAAGPMRNRRMLAEGKPPLVVAFTAGNGTANMIQQAKRAGVTVWEIDN